MLERTSRPSLPLRVTGVVLLTAAGIALIPLRDLKDVQFGRVSPGDTCFGLYRKYLKRTVEEPFALFLPG